MEKPSFGTKEFEAYIEETIKTASEDDVRQVLQKEIDSLHQHDFGQLKEFLKEGKLHNPYTVHFSLSRGLVSSAIYMKGPYFIGAKDFIRREEYGGLGVTISQTLRGARFSRNQLWFANLEGDALMNSHNSENALWYSQNSDRALKSSHNSGNALWYSHNSGSTLGHSTNSEFALFNSINSGNSLKQSINLGSSLHETNNSGRSLERSQNHQSALQGSYNSGLALTNAICAGNSLAFSDNQELVLRRARIRDFALLEANLGQGVLMKSPDKARVLSRGQVEDFSAQFEGGKFGYATLEEAGRVLGMTRENVRQIQKEAFKKIRNKINKLKLVKVNGGWKIFQVNPITIDMGDDRAYIAPDEPTYLGPRRLIDELAWRTKYPPYSSQLRDSDSIGQSTQYGNLVDYFNSGDSTRLLWGLREGLFEEQ